MPPYIATVLPGLERILGEEIHAVIADALLTHIERGKVFFTSRLPLEVLLGLRTADNLYRHIHRFQVGPHKAHLEQLELAIAKLDLSFIPSLHDGKSSYIVHASRKGKQTYTRFEAAEAAMRGMARHRFRCREGTPEAHDVEFRLDIEQEEAVFSLRLTDATFRYRCRDRLFSPAALRPTIAHAMVWISEPAADDVFLDPCCGSGTILSERAAYASRLLVGGDLSEEAFTASMYNTSFREKITLHQWDARQLPLDCGSVNKAVTNLPFGRQIAAEADMTALYRDILSELNRVLAADGSLICLTDAGDALQYAAERNGLVCSEMAALSLKGLHPTLYRLSKS